VHQTTINRIVKGAIRSTGIKNLEKIAAALRVSTAELTGAAPSVVSEQPTKYQPTNTALSAIEGLKVPVVDWAILGDQIPASIMSRRDIICPVPHGPGTVAVTVQGLAMQAPQGRSYSPGTQNFIDPNQTNAIKSGDPIVALLSNSST
ncbi:helix-turn-helix domain-containing protein, partial [Wenyingzhuangia sp. 1_MG-2023]|nr:helix-turn-helix domain-containing protein [Wenyingzhuangia sp. 1_MG-2023]